MKILFFIWPSITKLHWKKLLFAGIYTHQVTYLIYKLLTNILGILKVSTQNQQLFYKDEIMDENKTLSDCGINASIAKAQNPASIGLALR